MGIDLNDPRYAFGDVIGQVPGRGETESRSYASTS